MKIHWISKIKKVEHLFGTFRHRKRLFCFGNFCDTCSSKTLALKNSAWRAECHFQKANIEIPIARPKGLVWRWLRKRLNSGFTFASQQKHTAA
eukprot:32872-Pelagomonas_calceolata.AAC.2